MIINPPDKYQDCLFTENYLHRETHKHLSGKRPNRVHAAIPWEISRFWPVLHKKPHAIRFFLFCSFARYQGSGANQKSKHNKDVYRTGGI